MDYSPLTQPPTSIGETKELAETTRNSLYETLQGISDPRRGGRQTLPAASPALFAPSGEDGRTKHAQGSNGVGASASRTPGRLFWAEANSHALPNDIQADLRRHCCSSPQ